MSTITATPLEAFLEAAKGTVLTDLAQLVYNEQIVAVAAASAFRESRETLKGRVLAYERARCTLATDRMQERKVLWCRDCEYLKPHDGFKLLLVSHLDVTEKPVGTPTLRFVCADCSERLRELSADHKAMAFIASQVSGGLEVWRGGKRESFEGPYTHSADFLPTPIPEKLAVALDLPPALEFTIVAPGVFAKLSIVSHDGNLETLEV